MKYNNQYQTILKLLQNLKTNLNNILKQQKDCLGIKISSERILSFLVNDILDFAQLKAGKFRKNIQTFSIEKVINEMIKIFAFKAEQMAISVKC